MLVHLAIRRLTLATFIVAAATGMFTSEPARADTLAFPGAVGQGAAAVGGRGGDVYHVTNLSDYSEDKGETKIQGSLRHAIRSAKGPRTVVFDVGGAVQLHDPLEIGKSKITIAGQTSPGGITVYGYPCNVSKATDVVIRYIRMRTGDFNARAPQDARAAKTAAVGKGAKDLDAGTANGFDVGHGDRVILDHVSTAWGMDETLSVTHSRNVTIQNTIIAESLNSSFHPKGPHGFGSLVRGELTPADQEAGTGGYTFYGNLWAFHRARNPSIGGQQRLAPGQSEDARGRTDVNIVNNVIYGWGDQPTHRNEFGDVRINLVGNYYINGSAKRSDYIFRESNPARTFLFGAGNFHDADQDSTHNGKAVGFAAELNRAFHEFDERDQLLAPPNGKPFNFFTSVDGQILPAEVAYARVISQAGASLSRDAIDTRITEAVVHRTGSLIDSQDKFRGPDGKLPGIDDLPASERPADFDTDRDGMSNAFELEHHLNPNDPSDRNGMELSKDGYTNLEVYLNSLVPGDRHP